MKVLMMTAALLLACSSASLSARALGPVPTKPLSCDKVDVGTACYILQRYTPARIGDDQVLTYVDLKDARCPIGVDCVWAGYVEATFDWRKADGSIQSFSLLLDPRYRDTNVFRDEETGLTVTLNAVQARAPGPVPPNSDLVKVTVAYDL